MSDRFSAASEDSTSASNERVCELCGSASRTPTASGSSLDIGPESPAIPTCAPLWPTPQVGMVHAEKYTRETSLRHWREGRQVHLSQVVRDPQMCPCRCHRLMSSAAASPAKTSPSPAREQGSKEAARVFGPSTHDSLASFDPDTSSWRTSQLSLLGGLDEFSGTWPRSGMTRSGTAYQRQPLAPLTGGTAFGSWPTPRTSDTNGPGRHGTGGLDLRTAVAEAEAGLTKDGLYTTPCADDTGHRKGKYAQGGTALSSQAGGQLNPTWVEWLMNFPLGWTEVE